MLKYITLIYCICFSVMLKASTIQEIHIGLASNFSEVSTGSSNPYGGYFKDGVNLALKEAEGRLSKKGLKILLNEFDYGNNDVNVLPATKKAIQSNVVAVLGYNYSSNALLASTLHHESKLPMLTPSATANRLGSIGRYIHMGSFDNAFMGESLANVGRTLLKAKKAITLPAANCAYCSDLSDSFEKEFSNQGGLIVGRFPVLQDDKDFSSVIEKIKSLQFDVILVPNQELTSARMIVALVKAGINKPFLGADGWGNVGEEFFAVLEKVPFTGYSVSHWHPDLKTSRSIEFIKSYKNNYQKIPNDTSVLAYDSMKLLIEAVLNAKDLTREGIENSLNNIKTFSGVTGSFILSPNKAPLKSLVLLKTNSSKFSIQKVIKPRKK